MTRHLTFLALIGTLAIPAAALAQHQQGGAPSSGTATSSGSTSSGGSSSGSGGSTSSSSGGGSTTSTFSAGSPSGNSGGGRRRGGQPATGRAVARGTASGAGGTIIVGNSGFYPWGYAYGGAIGAYGGYYGGYYGAYDPWYGWFPTYAPSAYSDGDDSGAVRLKVKPADARVYVDGFYVGIVNDFDGALQKLRLDRGPHRIEMRDTNYQPLSVDVMIQEDFTITYRGELVAQ